MLIELIHGIRPDKYVAVEYRRGDTTVGLGSFSASGLDSLIADAEWNLEVLKKEKERLTTSYTDNLQGGSMEKERLLNIIKNQKPSPDTIGMILSNNMDFACEQGALISVKKFNDVSNDIIDYFKAYYGDRLTTAST